MSTDKYIVNGEELSMSEFAHLAVQMYKNTQIVIDPYEFHFVPELCDLIDEISVLG